MDITRNWRLKTSRSQLLATRCPVTGEVLLPGKNSASASDDREVYTFEQDEPRTGEAAARYAPAAR